MLRELLTTELELRRSAGEYPSLVEYQGRFPDNIALIEAAFAEIDTNPGENRGNDDRNLLLETVPKGRHKNCPGRKS